MHQLRFIALCIAFLISSTLSADVEVNKSTTESTAAAAAKVSPDTISTEFIPFETSHKIHRPEEFQTAHKIPDRSGFQRREDLHQSMRSKEKPELDDQLGQLIAADIRNNIEAKRLSEYEKYDVEQVATTAEPATLTTMSPVSVNEGLIDLDDFPMLEEAGSENKQTSRIQIKKGPNGQEYEYEYVYYYYDEDEKSPGDDDVIIGTSKKSAEPAQTTPVPQSSGKSRYSSVERGSSTATERNEIPSNGKGRSFGASPPAPVSEEQVEERLPQVTRFPQRAKSVSSSAAENIPEQSSGKRQHVKRPGLDLVDSHSFSNEKNPSKGPRVIETEHTKSESYESVSRSSLEYASTSRPSFSDEDAEDTTNVAMDKYAIDLYAYLANENAKEDDKKSRLEYEVINTTPVVTYHRNHLNADETTVDVVEPKPTQPTTTTTEQPTTTSTTTTTTTTTTTPAPTTTTTTTTTTTEAPRGRGGALTAGRNRFRLTPKSSPSLTEAAPAEASTEKPRNRFSRPSSSPASSPSFSGGRSTGSRASKITTTTAAPAEPKSIESKLNKASTRSRFSLRNQQPSSTTEKSVESGSDASSTKSAFAKPSRPAFSLRNNLRGRNAASQTSTAAPSTTETSETVDQSANNSETDEKSNASSTSAPRPTSRLGGLTRPGTGGRVLPGQKSRVSPLASRRGASSSDPSDAHKSDGEHESDAETTTVSNLNKLKNRPRIQVSADAKAKKAAAAAPVINRKVNPLISKRKFGVTSTTEPTAEENSSDEVSDKEGTNESEVEVKEEETTPAAESTSEQPRGIGGLLNRRKLASRRPGQL